MEKQTIINMSRQLIEVKMVQLATEYLKKQDVLLFQGLLASHPLYLL